MSSEKFEDFGIDKRLKTLIDMLGNPRDRYNWLAEITQIKSVTWKNFLIGRKKADGNMIEALSKHWPQHAFWLTTGLEDRCLGHVSPTRDEAKLEESIFRMKTANSSFEEENDEHGPFDAGHIHHLEVQRFERIQAHLKQWLSSGDEAFDFQDLEKESATLSDLKQLLSRNRPVKTPPKK